MREAVRNCGAVTRGEYCCDCGQREGRSDRYFLELAGELADCEFKGSDSLSLNATPQLQGV